MKQIRIVDWIIYVIIIVVAGSGFIFGYNLGRSDWNSDTKWNTRICTSFRAYAESSGLLSNTKAWLKWVKTIEESDELLTEIDKLNEEWDGEDPEVFDQVIEKHKARKEIIAQTTAPPGIEWYKQSIIENINMLIKSHELMKSGLIEDSIEKQRESNRIEEEACKKYIEMTCKYKKWLLENGY